MLQTPADALDSSPPRSPAWKWLVCGLLLLATMINYMDRQTLAQVATDIRSDFEARGIGFDDEDYGNLEMAFGIAFATGAIIAGFLVDYVRVFWMYPVVLAGWSAAGFATAYAHDYRTLIACRIVLGLFEAGHWPCALVTTQRILSREDRALGNGILQSGAALGAVVTPLIIEWMMRNDAGAWRAPFQIIGAIGLFWIVPWFALMRGVDIGLPPADAESPPPDRSISGETSSPTVFIRRFAALAVVVTMINACWHFFRAWLPKFLREFHEYDRTQVNFFSSAYYLATDAGSLTAGFLTRSLAARTGRVHRSRMIVFFACSLITALSLAAARQPRGPLLLGLLLVIGFGALGLFPNYYSFTQELSARHQGKISGTLGCITWCFAAAMQHYVGKHVEATKSYVGGLSIAGLAPLVGFVAMLLLWNSWSRRRESHAAAAVADPDRR